LSRGGSLEFEIARIGIPEASWRIDPLHRLAQFIVRHMMIPTAAKVEATIDCTSANAGELERDSDMKRRRVLRR